MRQCTSMAVLKCIMRYLTEREAQSYAMTCRHSPAICYKRYATIMSICCTVISKNRRTGYHRETAAANNDM